MIFRKFHLVRALERSKSEILGQKSVFAIYYENHFSKLKFDPTCCKENEKTNILEKISSKSAERFRCEAPLKSKNVSFERFSTFSTIKNIEN